jgi:hypothetical protein
MAYVVTFLYPLNYLNYLNYLNILNYLNPTGVPIHSPASTAIAGRADGSFLVAAGPRAAGVTMADLAVRPTPNK